MAQAINVTFKNNEKELKLYLEAVSHSSRGNWIKDCMEFYMNYSRFERQLIRLHNEEELERNDDRICHFDR